MVLKSRHGASYTSAATTDCCSYLIVALVLAEMLLQLAVSGKDLRTYSAFLLPIAESVHFAITGICRVIERERAALTSKGHLLRRTSYRQMWRTVVKMFLFF